MKKSFQEMNESEKVSELKKLGLTETEAAAAAKNGTKQTVEIREDHSPAETKMKVEDHKTFSEVDGSFRPVTKDGTPIRGTEGKAIVEKYQHLASCYEALGLNKKEALIAATVECRLVENDFDFSKLEF